MGRIKGPARRYRRQPVPLVFPPERTLIALYRAIARVRESRFALATYVWIMTVDHGSAMPPYRQLAGILRDQIASGELAPGAALPSVKRLRQEYGVAETTARKAVAVLRDEGLVETVMGWGSFVAKGS